MTPLRIEPGGARVVAEVSALSSMATRHLLADLAESIRAEHDVALHLRSGGGIEIARQIRDGAQADLVVLADDAVRALAAEGLLLEVSVRPLFVSDVVAAVPAGGPARALDTESDVRAVLRAAGRIAYSTGPSGSALLALIASWGLANELSGRLVQAPPGVPVGALLAAGDTDLGFQQRSELMDTEGVRLLGPLPGAAAIRSLFSGAVLTSARTPATAERVLALLVSRPDAVAARGMTVAVHGSQSPVG